MPNAHRPNHSRLIYSLIATAVVIVPIVWFATPVVYRWTRLRHLTSDDPNLRQPALVYVARHADADPAVLRTAISKLDDPRDEVFRALIYAIDMARKWERPTIPDTAWLRWINLLATDAEPSGRIFAAQQLGQLHDHDLADDRRVADLVAGLLSDTDDDVRMNALIAAGELNVYAVRTHREWHALLHFATVDDNPQIARQAWLLAGLVSAAELSEQGLRDMTPYVAQAAAWAECQTTQGRRSDDCLAKKLVRDPSLPMELRAAVAGTLIGQMFDERVQAMTHPLAQPTIPQSAAEQVFVWRLLLSGGETLSANERSLLQEHLTAARDAEDEATLAAVLPWACVAAYRLGEVTALPDFASPVATNLLALAALESPARLNDVASADFADTSELIHLLAVRREPTVNPAMLLPFMASDTPTVRELACMIAIDRLNEADLSELVRRSLLSFEDSAKMAGALLAGLTDSRPTREVGSQQVDLLTDRMEHEDIWAVKQVMRLGLWMQGRLPEMDSTAANLLSRNDIPRTHVLLAMLHRGDRTAYEVLFAPRGEPGIDLLQLLSGERWWYILRRYLPTSAPPLPLWADDDWKQMQIAILRDWYLLTGGHVITAAQRPPADSSQP